MKRRKGFNVRERQHWRYIRYLTALAHRSPDSEAELFTSAIPHYAPGFERHVNILANRKGAAAGHRLRRTAGLPW